MGKKRSKRKVTYKTGEFLLTTFSAIGARVGKQLFSSYEEANTMGKTLNKDVSYVISRIMFNSIEGSTNKWGYYPDKERMDEDE